MKAKKRQHDLSEWFLHLDKSLWLKGDDTGEEDAQFIVRTLALKSGDSVLDCPCGAGRIGIHLARAGCAVTGVDLQDSFLRRARRRFRTERLAGSFHRRDMRELEFADRFDAVVNWNGSFGYFTDSENLDVLRRFSRALKPGGRVVIEQLNREVMLRHFRPVMQFRNCTLHSRWNRVSECVQTTWIRSIGGRKRSCRSRMRIYTPGQFGRLFERAGLRVEAMYGSLDGSEYRRNSGRIRVVGRKVATTPDLAR